MKFLTTKEIAELCRVSVRTVESWRRRKQGPSTQNSPRGKFVTRYPLFGRSSLLTDRRRNE